MGFIYQIFNFERNLLPNIYTINIIFLLGSISFIIGYLLSYLLKVPIFQKYG